MYSGIAADMTADMANCSNSAPKDHMYIIIALHVKDQYDISCYLQEPLEGTGF